MTSIFDQEEEVKQQDNLPSNYLLMVKQRASRK